MVLPFPPSSRSDHLPVLPSSRSHLSQLSLYPPHHSLSSPIPTFLAVLPVPPSSQSCLLPVLPSSWSHLFPALPPSVPNFLTVLPFPFLSNHHPVLSSSWSYLSSICSFPPATYLSFFCSYLPQGPTCPLLFFRPLSCLLPHPHFFTVLSSSCPPLPYYRFCSYLLFHLPSSLLLLHLLILSSWNIFSCFTCQTPTHPSDHSFNMTSLRPVFSLFPHSTLHTFSL